MSTASSRPGSARLDPFVDPSIRYSKGSRPSTAGTGHQSIVSVQPSVAPMPEAPPDINEKRFHQLPQLVFPLHHQKITFYILFVVFCNLVVPSLIYYLLKNNTNVPFQTNIGISSASLGLSSCFDAPFRLYKLVRYRKAYGPLNDDVWWHGDFFMWMYTFALFVFAFPLAIAPALTPVAIKFFLMSTAMLIQPFGVVLLFTLFRTRLPVWCSSDPPGTPLKPGAFYVLEDLGAVDFREGRAWRTKCHERYAASPPFRSLMLALTYYWIIMTTLYTGITAAVTWAAPLNFAFGYILGQLFLWLAVASLGSWAMVHWGLKRERAWFEREGRVELRQASMPAGYVPPS
ncbi:hypothetical protein DL93DRAFT_2155295 [Clavulina sp. PMI_390]|nr:hypothetical protein DL93DRAFT_2155295 [Clavulina sp. PMI_390]